MSSRETERAGQETWAPNVPQDAGWGLRSPLVVLIDDSESICRSVAEMLGSTGCELHTFTRPEQGLEFLLTSIADVALIDVHMPGLGGLDLVRRASARCPDTVFMLMSSDSSSGVLLDAMREGVFDFVPKGALSRDALIAGVRRALEHHRLAYTGRLQAMLPSLTLQLEAVPCVGETRDVFFAGLRRGVHSLCPEGFVATVHTDGTGLAVRVDGAHRLDPPVYEAVVSGLKQLWPVVAALDVGLPAVVAPARIPPQLKDVLPAGVVVAAGSPGLLQTMVLLGTVGSARLRRPAVQMVVWLLRNAGIIMARHRRHEEQQRTTILSHLDRLPVGVLVMNQDCTQAEYLNSSARQLLGLGSGSELSGVRAALCRSFAGVDKVLDRQLDSGPAKLEARIAHGGDERWFEISVQALSSPGTMSYQMITFHDITHLRQEAREIRNLNEKLRVQNLHLEAANKELDNFVYIASHDLQEPFRRIQIFTELLGQTLVDLAASDTDTRFRLDQLAQNSDVALRILADLRTLSKLTRTHSAARSVPLNELVDEVLDRFGTAEVCDNVEFRVDALPVFRGEAPKIKELFHNLISNAIKYNTSAKKVVHIGALSGGSKDVVFVRDNGVGVEPEFFSYIFEPFKILPVKGIARGTGLGLYIVKKMAEEHGGRVWLESKPGEGSTFFVQLPLSRRSTHRT